ncbi:site-specific integrase [Neobacillus pocheonensis]|uniref:Site-specific integrase n=1 Tax=Neobacillus pocheonensis TaxID=363869 RepID=A0ABT0WHY7_9BACI|nr:site-specific integrase [Neobacillus pocheonensis]
MNVLEQYQESLFNSGKSALKVKNEVSSVRAFLGWFIGWNNMDFVTKNYKTAWGETVEWIKYVPVDSLIDGMTARTIREWRDAFTGKASKPHMQIKPKTASTLNKDMQRLSRFFEFAKKEIGTFENPTELHDPLVEAKFAPKYLSKEQQEKLKRAVKKMYVGSHLSKKNYRNYTLIMFLLNTGLREDELCNLKTENLLVIKNGKEVKYRVKFFGKFGIERSVTLNKEFGIIFKDYLENYKRKGEYLFDSERSEKLTTRAIQHIVAEVSQHLDFTFTGHQLRHTFIKNLVDVGANLELVARVRRSLSQGRNSES